jgi:hypothetical protein
MSAAAIMSSLVYPVQPKIRYDARDASLATPLMPMVLFGEAPMIPATWLTRVKEEINMLENQNQTFRARCTCITVSKDERFLNQHILIQWIIVRQRSVLPIEGVTDEIMAPDNLISRTEACSEKGVVVVDA